MYKVFIDTNFFILYTNNFNIIKEVMFVVPGKVEFITTQGVIDELKSLKIKEKKFVLKIINQLIKNGKLKVLPYTGYVDKWLLSFISQLPQEEKKRFIVCTNDAELRKMLKEKGIKVISLKGMNKIEIM